MCEDQPEEHAISRRTLLGGAAASAVAGILIGEDGWTAPAKAATTFDGTIGRSMAMHVHSSFSEQEGSMESQLLQAEGNGVDVLWWTDHDYRMSAWRYRKTVHFTSLTAETTREGGKPWKWIQRTSGSLTRSSSGGIASLGSPKDPVAGSSLAVSAQSTSTAPASLGFYAETQQSGWNERCNLYGQTITLEVLPTSIGIDGYLELHVATSRHPAQGGRPAGNYSLSYRIGGPGVPGTRTTNGLIGIMHVSCVRGEWNTVTVTPCDDISALWPDMDARDFASWGFTLSAVSLGGQSSGNFDYLRIARQYTSGDIPLQRQQSIGAGYAGAYAVAQRQGVEMSGGTPHINWFGGAVSLPDYTGVTGATYPSFIRQQVDKCHASGGLTSYNHPYGADSTLTTQSAQDTKLAQTATALLQNKAMGTDILEVGYPARGGCDLAHHLRLWDALSRNAVFLTGNGVNDNHSGSGWLTRKNNWATSAWAPSVAEGDLLTALKAGRVWTNSLKAKCALDLQADGGAPMGSASVSSVSSRTVTVYATGLPTGSTVEVVRGTVDYAGTSAPAANSTVVASYGKAAFGSGSVPVTVDTTTSRFVRTQVRNSAGAVVATSNPVWLLRETPPNGIPPIRHY